ncbi:transmembrane protein 65 isoform X2 [Periplaneta americana]|uniref:transmembrane protein 65 isoform X2 n=1 Tax=Periplaneta americana TaxID=6978 RepID=UPI0037E8F15D
MNTGSTLNGIINCVSMASRTQRVTFHSGIRRIFNCWNSGYSATTKSKFRCFHSSLQGAPNTSYKSLIVGYAAVDKRYNLQTYKSVVQYVQKEVKLLYSSSTSALDEEKTHSLTGPLTKLQAHDLIMRLTGEERTALLTALQEFQSEKRKAEYEAESVPVPNARELWRVAVHNAVPFVGFGFLDNFIMIIAGDQIEMMLGSIMVLSTMAAAALGNTISDVMGIGSAWYVERMAVRIGMQPPKLSPIQLDMPSSRRAANMGRAMGVTLGCLLGMLPLLFLGKKIDDSKEEEPT